jgi:hypothetical protein
MTARQPDSTRTTASLLAEHFANTARCLEIEAVLRSREVADSQLVRRVGGAS